MSDEVPSIYTLMGRVLADLPAIGKDSYNEQQKFKFRGIDDVMNALNPLLAQHGVFFVPHVLERIESERATRGGSAMYVVNLHVQYRFYGPAGDYVEASGWGEGTDMGDKATNKAMTGAMKYVLFQAFAISTAEAAEDDSDRGAPEETNGSRRAQHAPLAEQTVPESMAKRLTDRMNALPHEQRAKCKTEFASTFGKPAELKRGQADAAEALVASYEVGGTEPPEGKGADTSTSVTDDQPAGSVAIADPPAPSPADDDRHRKRVNAVMADAGVKGDPGRHALIRYATGGEAESSRGLTAEQVAAVVVAAGQVQAGELVARHALDGTVTFAATEPTVA